MDQTPGATPPPTTDTPNTSDQPTTPPVTPPVGDTPATDTPSTPPTDPATPSGPPPVTETPATPESPTEAPAVPASETPAEHPTETPPAPEETPTTAETPATPATETPAPTESTTTPPTETAASGTPASDAHTPASAPSADAHSGAPADPPHDHKSMSKPLMVTAGLLIVGALSAVMLVANMQPGDTQSSAKTPTRPPALPTQASETAQNVVTNDPNLTINTPKQNSIVSTPEVTVDGKTFPNAEVSVNEQEITANAGGGFTAKVALDEGENTIVVTANDADGNTAEQELVVTYETE